MKIRITCLFLIFFVSTNTSLAATTLSSPFSELRNLESVMGYSESVTSSGFAIPLAQCTLFVSTSGADLNNGATPENAFKTIKKGLESIKPGQSLCIQGGTYSEVLKIDQQGTEQEPIAFGGYSTGGEVILTGGYKIPTNKCTGQVKRNVSDLIVSSCHDTALLTISGARFINIYALTIKESSGSGVLVGSNASNITFKSVNVVNNNLSGIKLGLECKDVVSCSQLGASAINIDSSRFNDNGVLSKIVPHETGAGVFVNDAIVTHLLINNTTITGNLGYGVHVHNADFVTVSNSLISDNAVQNMYVRNNNTVLIDKNAFLCTEKGLSRFATANNSKTLEYATGLQVGGATSQKTTLVDYGGYTITNNIIAGCSSNLVLNAQKSQLKDTNIVNNTLVNARTRLKRLTAARSLLLVGFNVENVTVSNNIIMQKDDKVRTVVGIVPTPALKTSNNMVHPAISKSLVGEGFVVSDPKLKDPFIPIDVNTLDVSIFKPAEDSPVVGKGTVYTIPTLQVDYSGIPRAVPDIGALQAGNYTAQITDGDKSELQDSDSTIEPFKPDEDEVLDPSSLVPVEAEVPKAGEDETVDPDLEIPVVSDSIVDSVPPEDITLEPLQESSNTLDEGYLPESTLENELDDAYLPTEESWPVSEEVFDYSSTFELTEDINEKTPVAETGLDDVSLQDPNLSNEIITDSAVFGTLPDTNAPTGGEILKNGNFDLGKNTKGMPLNWFVKTGVGGSVSLSLDGKKGEADVDKILSLKVLKLPEKGLVELYQNGLSLDRAKKYKLTFTVKSDMGSDIELYLANAVFPYDHLTGTKYNVDLKPDWKEYSGIISLVTDPAQAGKVRLVISFKASVGDSVVFDSISLYEMADDLSSVTSGNLISTIDSVEWQQLASRSLSASN